MDCDFYAFSGHKLYGPTGIGVLYGKRELLERMPPFMGGGDMVDTVTFAKTTYAPVPLKFEAGTANFVGAIGLGEAVKFMQRFDPAQIEAHEEALLRRATERLEGIGGLRIYGTAPRQVRHCVIQRRGGASLRYGHDPRQAGHCGPYGPALRRTRDGPLRNDGHVPGLVRAVQHTRRGRCTGRGGRTGGEDASKLELKVLAIFRSRCG